jgi:hypothetical protein
MKVLLTPEESEKLFFDAMCNGLGYIAGYGLSLKFNREEYKETKDKLENPCYEEVLMQMLRDGKTLKLKDMETDDDDPASITLKDIHERMELVPLRHLTDALLEDDDAITADAILQTVFFKELVYA